MILVVAVGAGYLLVGRGGGGNNSHHHHHGGGTILATPGCSSASAPGKALTGTQSKLALIGQSPTGIAATPDGHWVFTSTGGSAAQAGSVIAMRVGTGLTLTVRRSYQFTSPTRGEVLTSDGHYLLIAAGAGVSVLNVRTFTRGARGSQIGTLPLPRSTGQGGALDVALSPDNKYVFMAPVHGDTIAVFNLAKALSSGHLSISDLVGNVQLGSQPTAMALSPDGNWLYVTSSPGGRANTVGQLTVLNAHTAEVTPPASVVRSVTAGCYPDSVTTSTDGNVVWVSARDSDDVLAYSAAKLQADPKRSLIAATRVGRQPMGLLVAAGGDRLVVADSDIGNPSAKGYLSVLSTTPAGKATLLGSIPSGLAPQDLALVPGTQVMLITDGGSNQIQLINLATLP